MTRDLQESILRATARFVNKRIEALEPRLKSIEERQMTPGPKGDPGKPGADGEPGKDGEDGKSVTIDEVRTLFEGEVAKWALDFERRASDVLDRAVERMPNPKDGVDGVDGLGHDDMRIEHDGERAVSIIWERDGKEKRKDLILPVVIDRGIYKAAQVYESGDGVTWAGSYWICQKATSDKPGTSDWRLAVKKGRDGKSNV